MEVGGREVFLFFFVFFGRYFIFRRHEVRLCANLQGNVLAFVPHRLQKARLPVAQVQQLASHAVVHVEEVVRVGPGVLHHLLRQGAACGRVEGRQSVLRLMADQVSTGKSCPAFQMLLKTLLHSITC